MRFSTLVHRLDSPGGRAWDIHNAAQDAKAAGRDVIFASVGDPHFDTPEPVTARAVEALRAGDTHYSEIAGRQPLRAAIAARLAAEDGRAVAADNVIVVAGAQNGLFAAALCLLEPGCEVIVVEPAYVTYEATFGLTGATLVRVGTSADTGFRPDPAAIAAAVTPRTRAILLSNPNNPTGTVATAAELDGIAAIATAHDLWVIVDEVYRSLTFERPHLSLAARPGMAERTVAIGSLSKSHAMTGWRVGWVAGPAEFVRHVDRLALNMLYGLPGFIQEAAVAGLARYDAITAAMRESYRTHRDLVVAELGNVPRLRVLTPEAGMFVLLDARATGRPALDLGWDIFRATGVSLLDASAFGAAAHGFLRMSYGLPEDELREACRRLRGFFIEDAHVAAG